MRMRLLAAAAAALAAGPAFAQDLNSPLAAILAVGREGAGNEDAAAGWKALVAAGQPALKPTLTAFDSASPTAANWLRSVIDAVVENEAKAGRPVPAGLFQEFLADTKRNPAARRIAYEFYAKTDAAGAAAVLPTLIDDPSLDLRRDAVAARLAKKPGKDELKTLFAAARDVEQVEKIAAELKAQGESIDLTKHFGFLTEWRIVGPFDSPGGAGFAQAFPPETNADTAAKYPGKGGEVAWKPATAETKSEKDKGTQYATLDLNALLGKHKDAAAYALAVVELAAETPVDLRAASQNSVVLFVNGKKVFEREEYHHGTTMDQHVGKAVLKPGRNEILVKVVQNDQKEPWAQVWTLSLRVSDHLGGPVMGVKSSK